MPARVRFGSKNNFARGPASSNNTSSPAVTAGSRTISKGIFASSLTAYPTGEGNRASPSEVIFIYLISLFMLPFSGTRQHVGRGPTVGRLGQAPQGNTKTSPAPDPGALQSSSPRLELRNYR